MPQGQASTFIFPLPTATVSPGQDQAHGLVAAKSFMEQAAGEVALKRPRSLSGADAGTFLRLPFPSTP